MGLSAKPGAPRCPPAPRLPTLGHFLGTEATGKTAVCGGASPSASCAASRGPGAGGGQRLARAPEPPPRSARRLVTAHPGALPAHLALSGGVRGPDHYRPSSPESGTEKRDSPQGVEFAGGGGGARARHPPLHPGGCLRVWSQLGDWPATGTQDRRSATQDGSSGCGLQLSRGLRGPRVPGGCWAPGSKTRLRSRWPTCSSAPPLMMSHWAQVPGPTLV